MSELRMALCRTCAELVWGDADLLYTNLTDVREMGIKCMCCGEDDQPLASFGITSAPEWKGHLDTPALSIDGYIEARKLLGTDDTYGIAFERFMRTEKGE